MRRIAKQVQAPKQKSKARRTQTAPQKQAGTPKIKEFTSNLY